MKKITEIPKMKLFKVLYKRYPNQFSRIRGALRRGEITPKEAIEKVVQAKVVSPVKKSPEVSRVLKAGDWKIGVKAVDNIGCHPHPEQFRPKVLVNRKNKTVCLIVSEGIYESNRHYNRISYEVLDVKETEKGFAVLVHYKLFRSGLDFGRWREFNYLAGYEDGSTFIDRVSPQVKTVNEALEWLKPAEVRKAEVEGRIILRQGDVFFVELKTKKRKITDYFLPENHRINGNMVVHREHSTIVLPHLHFKPVVRKTLNSVVYD